MLYRLTICCTGSLYADDAGQLEGFSVSRAVAWMERMRKHYRTAETLGVFGAAHEAMNMPGIGPDERTESLQLLSKHLIAAYGAAYHTVSGLASSSRVAGLPRVLVNALLANVDARSHLLKRYPELYGKLNEYALDTDDLEFLFSALALRAGWNCPAVQQLRLLRSIRRLAHLRSDPNSGISLPHSQHAKYGTERCIINSLTPETI